MDFRLTTYSVLIETNEELSFLRNNSSDAITIIDTKETFYNDRKDRKRIRFTLMHELGHIVLNTKDEDEADNFAAEILAPINIAVWKNLRTADVISRYFDISISAANRLVYKINNHLYPEDDSLIRYFSEDHVVKSRSVRIDREYRVLPHEDIFLQYAERDKALRDKHGPDLYWDLILDRLEREQLRF